MMMMMMDDDDDDDDDYDDGGGASLNGSSVFHMHFSNSFNIFYQNIIGLRNTSLNFIIMVALQISVLFV
jgi:hypothetical protein